MPTTIAELFNLELLTERTPAGESWCKLCRVKLEDNETGSSPHEVRCPANLFENGALEFLLTYESGVSGESETHIETGATYEGLVERVAGELGHRRLRFNGSLYLAANLDTLRCGSYTDQFFMPEIRSRINAAYRKRIADRDAQRAAAEVAQRQADMRAAYERGLILLETERADYTTEAYERKLGELRALYKDVIDAAVS